MSANYLINKHFNSTKLSSLVNSLNNIKFTFQNTLILYVICRSSIFSVWKSYFFFKRGKKIHSSLVIGCHNIGCHNIRRFTLVSEFDTHHLTNQVPHHPKLPTSYQVPCIMSCYVTSISCTYCHFLQLSFTSFSCFVIVSFSWI